MVTPWRGAEELRELRRDLFSRGEGVEGDGRGRAVGKVCLIDGSWRHECVMRVASCDTDECVDIRLAAAEGRATPSAGIHGRSHGCNTAR